MVFLFFAAVLASSSLLQSSLFTLTDVEVVGAETIDPDLIRQMSGLVPGESLLTLDPKAVEERILREVRLADVEVTRRWPHGVRVRVTERRPVALLPMDSGWLAVDADGVLFPADPSWSGRLPTLTGIDPGSGLPGTRLDEPAPQLLALLTGPGLALFQRISELHLAEDGTVDLYLQDPVRVRLGPLDAAADKFPVLLAVLKDLDARGAKAGEIDLRLGSPVIRPR
ncbi:MAG TPA: FtsQ-type POTRA domain-containing protein [Limnochorda sp.]